MSAAAAEPLPTAPDGRRAAVVHEHDLEMRPFPTEQGAASHREPIDETTDCRQLIQRVIALDPNTRTAQILHEESEDVLYVARGIVRADVGGVENDMKPGAALYVPPGTGYHLATAEGPGVLVSVLSPQPARTHEMVGAGAEAGAGWGMAGRSTGPDLPGGSRPAMTGEEDQDPLPAGDDRFFKLLIDPRFGCRHVTQFVGFIERSRAPYHTHTYEEVIYILGGDGIVHIDDRHVAVHAGTSIFLPPGVPHCLENAGDATLKLLGVFSPAGSPADHADVRTTAPLP